MKRLEDIINDCATVSGFSTKEIAKQAIVYDDDIIRTKENAYKKEGGIAVLHGNIAPDGAVIKQSALSDDMRVFKGPLQGSLRVKKKRCGQSWIKKFLRGQ